MKDPALVELQRYLHREIPLSEAMGVSVLHAADDGVRLAMPLGPNLNHRGTLFGGSGAALAILAGWSLVHERLRGEEGLTPHLVIQRSTMEYVEPVVGDVEARCGQLPAEAWERFVRTLRRKGKARIEVDVEVVWEGRIAGRLSGTFAALERLGGGGEGG